MVTEQRLIDLDKLIAYFEGQYNIAMDDPDHVSGYVMAAIRTCIAYFKTIPTVDAVEVVYCKDCTRRKKGYCTIRKDSWGATLLVGDHDFCSDGERRTDG